MAYIKQTWKDEVLNGPEQYNITAPGTNINGAKITLSTPITQAGTPITAERMNHIEDGIANNVVNDTGRIALPLAAGWTLKYQAPAYRKVGQLVELSGNVSVPSGAADQAIIGTLPAGYRPVAIKYIPVVTPLGIGRIDIEAGGAIKYRAILPSNPVYIDFSCVMFHIN